MDCNDNDPNVTTQPGAIACNDGDPTINDLIDANCTPEPSLPAPVSATTMATAYAQMDCNDNDPQRHHTTGQACSSGDPTAINDLIDANCNCNGIQRFLPLPAPQVSTEMTTRKKAAPEAWTCPAATSS